MANKTLFSLIKRLDSQQLHMQLKMRYLRMLKDKSGHEGASVACGYLWYQVYKDLELVARRLGMLAAWWSEVKKLRRDLRGDTKE